MIRDREIRDWAEAARTLGVTRARMTQIANLLLLDPSIQASLLDINGGDGKALAPTEHDLRSVLVQSEWKVQRELWHQRFADAVLTAMVQSDLL